MLTDHEIEAIAVATKSAEPGRDGYILPFTFARAIEQSATAPLMARIAEIEAELEKTKAIFAASCNHAAVMEMERDARRYRWLRETSYLWPSGYAIYSDEQVESVALWHKKVMTTADIDAAIDAAMKGE